MDLERINFVTEKEDAPVNPDPSLHVPLVTTHCILAKSGQQTHQL